MSVLKSVLTLLPILWLIIALAVLKMPGHKACASALPVAAVLALLLWRMPVIDCATSVLEGIAAALWPIILVIVAAIFTYNLSLKTGAMDVIKRMLTGVSADKRIIILLIGWCFGGFLEGMAGFGTAVAIPASMLAGMGVDPVTSCLVCMIANSFPTAFGSVGIPTVTLAGVTGLEAQPLAFTTVFEMAPLMLLLPFLMVMAGGGGFKALKGVTGITLVSGITFLLPELVVSRFIGPELTVIVGCVFSLASTIAMARMRKNAPIPDEYNMGVRHDDKNAADSKLGPLTALLPFILIFVLLLVTSKLVVPVNSFLSSFKSSVKLCTSEKAGLTTFNWVNTPGIMIFLAAIIGGIAQKASGKLMLDTFIATLKQMSKTMITIMSVLAVAKIMTYSGMISDMANLFVSLTGKFYPFVATIIAALGAFVTGSGTNTEVLFGRLQSEAALAIGASQYWLAAANSVGAGIGKVLSPQCIATAVAAAGLTGQDSKVLSEGLKWMLVLLVISCLWIGFGIGLSPY